MLFAIGGLVRSTGSGMGCPDWPKCFGEYVPPTSADNLPENYEDYFKDQRIKKTERFVALLRMLGMEDKAEAIESNKNIEETHEFNVTKAYVEYGNRIWGALTGIVVFLGFLSSLFYIRQDFTLFLYTLLGFIAVFVNALLGAIVVSSNLISGLVTAHFLAAFASICFFMLARFRVKKIALSSTVPIWVSVYSLAVLVLIVFQTVLGTDVKSYFEALESGDSVIKNVILTEIPSYPAHRVYAVIAVIASAIQLALIQRYTSDASFNKFAILLVVLTLLQIAFGVSMIYELFMAISKLFHISIAASIFGIQFYICTLLIKAGLKRNRN